MVSLVDDDNLALCWLCSDSRVGRGGVQLSLIPNALMIYSRSLLPGGVPINTTNHNHNHNSTTTGSNFKRQNTVDAATIKQQYNARPNNIKANQISRSIKNTANARTNDTDTTRKYSFSSNLPVSS